MKIKYLQLTYFQLSSRMESLVFGQNPLHGQQNVDTEIQKQDMQQKEKQV